MQPTLPEEEIDRLKKRNRVRRLSPKRHKIVHESGRSTKTLWQQIIERARNKKP